MRGITRFIRFLKNLRIRTKILLFYSTLIIVSLLLSMFIYMQTNTYYLENEVKEVALSELESISNSMENLIDDINAFSMTVYSDRDLQDLLSDKRESFIDYGLLNRDLGEAISFNEKISAVYVYKNSGQKYYADKNRLKNVSMFDIRFKPWYLEVDDRDGGSLLNVNGSGLLYESDHDYLTLFRIVKGIHDQRDIGLMMVCTDFDYVRSYLGINEDYKGMFVYQNYDDDKSIPMKTVEGIDYDGFLMDIPDDETVIQIVEHNDERYVLSGLVNTAYGFRIFRARPIGDTGYAQVYFNVAFLLIVIVNAALIVFGSFYFSKSITDPISKLTSLMKEIEKGNFAQASFTTNDDEIGILKSGYNLMINEIQNLIDEIIREQKMIKKAEFNVILEQIKPHFLYNTIDSISSLVILERYDEAYKSLRALGSFYRNSLSDRNAVVTINDEIQIIKDYIFIQQIRYGDLFVAEYNVDNSVGHIRVPKLILQPLVENSIYHGIRPKGEPGVIRIVVQKIDDFVYLTVEDNGMGIPEEKIHEMVACDNMSVGIPATKERIKTHFNESASFNINSTFGEGTSIQMAIPWKGERIYEI